MKKSILTLAAAATFTLIGTQAFACYWDGYWGGPMGGPMAGVQSNGNYQDFYEKRLRSGRILPESRVNTTRLWLLPIPIPNAPQNSIGKSLLSMIS